MAHWGSGRHTTPIGIDITRKAIHAVQFQVSGRKIVLHDTAVQGIDLIDDDEASIVQASFAALKSLVEDGRFSGSKVIATLPKTAVDIRPLRIAGDIDSTDLDALEAAWMKQAHAALIYPAEDAVLNFLPLEEPADRGSSTKRALLIAAKKVDVLRHMALIKETGLQCVHLEVGAAAAARIFGADQKTIAIMEWDADCAVISIVHGRHLLFSRTIQIGLETITRALADSLDLEMSKAGRMLQVYGIDHEGSAHMSLETTETTGLLATASLAPAVFEICTVVLEQIAIELERSSEYCRHQKLGGLIEKLILVGGPIPPGLDRWLADRLSIEVAEGDPFEALGLDEHLPPSAGCVYGVAAGLALKEEIS